VPLIRTHSSKGFIFLTPSFRILQVSLASHPRRKSNAYGTALVSSAGNVKSVWPLTLAILPPFHNLVYSALLKTERGANPYSATALHALPCIASYLSAALGVRTLETAVEEALFESWSHPGKRMEEMVRTSAVKGRRG
jgi:hypothetical protein